MSTEPFYPKKFRVTSSLDVPAVNYKADVTGSNLFQNASASDRITLRAGFVRDGVRELVTLVEDATVDFYNLSVEPDKVTGEVTGRDGMAKLLETEYRMVYRNGPSPEVISGAVTVPETNGTFRASQIASDICAAAGLISVWGCPDYVVNDTFNAVGRPIDLLQSLVAPFCLRDATKVDVFTSGQFVHIRARSLSPTAPPGNTFSVRDLRVQNVKIRKFRTDLVGLVTLTGMHQYGPPDPEDPNGSGKTPSPTAPFLDWIAPSPITWPAPITEAMLNPTAVGPGGVPIPGTFEFSPNAGETLDPGHQTLTAYFTPDDPQYKSGTVKTAIDVFKADPVVHWDDPVDVPSGTVLGDDQLDATATDADDFPLDGVFTYAPPSGTVLTAGTKTLAVTFTPSDSTHYSKATATATLVVTGVAPPKTPVIVWPAPDPIFHSVPVDETQLNAVAQDPDTEAELPGVYEYSPPSGTVLGVSPSKTLRVHFTPTDSATYEDVSATQAIEVRRVLVTWAQPADVPIGTALGDDQLNATANTTGAFAYEPAAGTVLNDVGPVSVTVTFTPDTEGADVVTYSRTVRVVDPDDVSASPLGVPGVVKILATDILSDPITGKPIGSIATESVYRVPDNILLSEKVETYAFGALGVALWDSRALLVKKETKECTWEDSVYDPNGSPLNQPRQLGETRRSVSVNEDRTEITATQVITTYTYDDPKVDPRGLLSTESETTYENRVQAFDAEPGQQATDIDGNPAVWADGTPMVSGGATAGIFVVVNDDMQATTPKGLVIKRYKDRKPGFYAVETFSFAWVPSVPQGFWEPDLRGSGISIAAGTRPGGVDSSAGNIPNLHSKEAGPTNTPLLQWDTPEDIDYPTALGDDQLNAFADVEGTFAYSPPAGFVLNAGHQRLLATFTPADPTYKVSEVATNIVVNKRVPVILWDAPYPISEGTPLDETQLNAVAVDPDTLEPIVGGVYAYVPPSGTVLKAGTHELHLTFTPPDPTNWDTVTAVVELEVTGTPPPTTPNITWDFTEPLEGAPLRLGFELNAVATDPDTSEPVPGVYAYSPPPGTELAAGGHNLHVRFTPADSVTYRAAVDTVFATVARVLVAWSKPSPVTVGDALDETQLDATANVEGAFEYNPPAGTIMDIVGTVTLSVTFTPAGGAAPISKSVTLKVNEAPEGGSGGERQGPESEVSVQFRCSPDPGAPPVDFSDSNLDKGALQTVGELVCSASGLWQHEVTFTGIGTPWVQRGEVVKLTDLVDETGAPLEVPALLVIYAELEYDEAESKSVSRQIRGLAWTADP